MDFLDYSYVQTLVEIIGVVAALAVYFLQKKKRRLVYDELQNLSLIGVNDKIKDKVEIKYAGKVVNDLHLLTVLLKNSGNTSIKKSDIVSPIKLLYNQGFIECTVIEKSTEELDIKLVFPDANSVVVNFDLLNQGEYFVLQFISLSRLSDPKIEFRIDNLTRISSSMGPIHYLIQHPPDKLFHISVALVAGVFFYDTGIIEKIFILFIILLIYIASCVFYSYWIENSKMKKIKNN